MPSNILITPQTNGLVGMVFNLGGQMMFSCRLNPNAAEKVGKELIMAAHELRKEDQYHQKQKKKV